MKLLSYSFLALFLTISLSCTKKMDSAKARIMLVGTDAAYAPFESEGPNKELKGFDVEILKAIAAKGGFEIKFLNTPWEGLFTQLSSGDRDILISAITINDTRKKQMDFSNPYFEAVQLIAVPAASKVQKMDDLKNLKVGVQTGTTGDDVVTALLGKASPSIKRFEGTPLAIKELEDGGVDAVVADNGVINNFLANNKVTFKVVSDKSFSKEYYGIAVKRGNAGLLGKINKGLEAIKADGTYDRIFKSYFGEKK